MKKPLIFACIFLCIIFSACKMDEESNTSKAIVTDNVLDEYLRIEVPQFKKKEQRVYYVGWGRLSGTSHTDSVVILSDAQYINEQQSDVYMLIDMGGKQLYKELGTFDKMVLQNGGLSLADVDGDKIDEIVIHFESSGNGGTITRVYKIENETIFLLSDLSELDTGYTGKFENGYKLRISNKNTGNVNLVDISGYFSSDFFNDEGKAVVKENIYLRPFSSCEVKDTDKDGIFELFCIQEVSLSGYIGKAYTKLQFNNKTKSFEVKESNFVAK